MRMIPVPLAVLQAFTCLHSRAENPLGSDAKESYVNSFFSALGVSFQSETTNTPAWRLPESVSFQGTNWPVQPHPDADGESRVFCSVSSPDGLTNLTVMADNLPTCDGVRLSLASAINLPCNLPATMLAASFSAEHRRNGIEFLFGPRPGCSGKHVFVVCRNLVLCFSSDSFEFGNEFGLSLLRAGGVEIPDEPAPQNPEPE